MNEPILTDNPNVPVFYFRRFLSPNYKPLKDNYKMTEIESTYTFYNDNQSRVATITVCKEVFWLDCFFVDPYPHGFFYNIDWNDSLFIEVCKMAGPQNILALISLLNERGYRFGKQYNYLKAQKEARKIVKKLQHKKKEVEQLTLF